MFCAIQLRSAFEKRLVRFYVSQAHGDKNLMNDGQFRVLKECHGKFDCLVYEILFFKEVRPIFNTPSVTPSVLNSLFNL